MLRRRPDPVVTPRAAALFGVLIALGAAALVVPFLPEGDEFREGDIAPQALAAANGNVWFKLDGATDEWLARFNADMAGAERRKRTARGSTRHDEACCRLDAH